MAEENERDASDDLTVTFTVTAAHERLILGVLAFSFILLLILLCGHRLRGTCRMFLRRCPPCQNVFMYFYAIRKEVGVSFCLGVLFAVVGAMLTSNQNQMSSKFSKSDNRGMTPPIKLILPRGSRYRSIINATSAEVLPLGNFLEGENKVVFITTTVIRMEEIAILSKLGQAIYPVRKQVVWIIVSLTDDEDLVLNRPGGKYGKVRMKPSIGKKPGERMKFHLKRIEAAVKRFGVSYVLLRVKNSEGLLQKLSSAESKEKRRKAKGLEVGMMWALNHFKNGVIILGDEQFAYHHKIFKEAKYTKIASAWAVGLGRLGGFSSPVIMKDASKVIGYHNGEIENVASDFTMEMGSFALNIEYCHKIKAILTNEKIAQLTEDSLTFSSLDIPLKDIQVLGNNGTEILVWRTTTVRNYWPLTLRLQPHHRNSNLIKLWQNLFGVMYDQIPVDTKYRDKNYTGFL